MSDGRAGTGRLPALGALGGLLLASSCGGGGGETAQAFAGDAPGLSDLPPGGPSGCRTKAWDPRSFPLTVSYAEDFQGDFDRADDGDGLNPLQEVLMEWNRASPLERDFFETETPVTAAIDRADSGAYEADGRIGIYKSLRFRHWPEVRGDGTPVAMALVQLTKASSDADDCFIANANIVFNHRHFDFFFGGNDDRGPWKKDFRTALRHEVGHLLGLDHRTGDSVMVASHSGVVRVTETDRRDARALYEDAPTAPGHMPVPRFSPDGPYPPAALTEVRAFHADGVCRHTRDGRTVLEHRLTSP